MKKFLLFAGALFLFFPMFVFADTDHLVISQVQITGGTGKTTNDFVEIYNPTGQDIDLKGYRLVKRTKTGDTDTSLKSWTASVIIKAHGFYLWANSGFTDVAVTPDASTTGSVADDNGVAIRNGPNDTGAMVDSVAWGAASNIFVEGAAFTPNPTANQSLERLLGGDAGNGTDTNNNIADFVQTTAHPRNSQSTAVPVLPPPPPADTPPPAENPPASEPPANDNPPASENSPVIPPEPLYSSAIIISEVLPNPDGNDSGEEWIELYNNSSKDVDLSGWTLDDESDSGIIGKDAYVILDGSTIKALSYLVIDLPPEAFALNNTGGDMVRLFWPDQTLLTSVTYTTNAKEDTSYALKPSGAYDWTSLVTKDSANQFPDNFLTGITSDAETKIKFNEIFPNPVGPDSGGEWVEIFNSGTEPIYIHNWTLDDGLVSDPIGSSAYKIQSPTISPGGLAVLVIPAGKFALNNTTDTVRLFNENNVLIDSITYQDAKEGLSYALVDNKWDWLTPTPNAVNQSEQKSEQASVVVINELFPEPESGGEEFIELYNPTDQEQDLTGFKLADLAADYKLSSKIATHEFLVIKKSDSKIALNNSGKEVVTLTDPKGMAISSVEYEDAPKLQSYNLLPDGTYAWSSVPTPGSTNVIKAALLDAKTSGRIKGAALPRTGNDQLISMWDAFVIWGIIWYIYVKSTNVKENSYEQTRVG